jgi:hypothetical protein
VRRAAVSAIGAAPIVVIGRGTGIDLALVTTVAEADGDVASNKRQRASFELNSPKGDVHEDFSDRNIVCGRTTFRGWLSLAPPQLARKS